MSFTKRSLRMLALIAVLLPAGRVAASPQLSAADQPATQRAPARNYVLGPDDEISILALEAEEISNKPFRVDATGYIRLPMLGEIKAAGLTLAELEAEIGKRLKVYIQQPQLSVNIVAFRSQPFSVLGFVGSPGVFQLEGRKTLVEVLAKAGGVRPDGSNIVRITRKAEYGPIPLPDTRQDAATNSYIAEVDFQGIMEGTNPASNIEILPYDVISVARAKIIYVMGEVRRPAGFALADRQSVGVIKALAMAEGLSPIAKANNAHIIRTGQEVGTPQNIPVKLKEILEGKQPDVRLLPEDILYVPASAAKAALRTGLDTVVRTVSGAIIYRGW